MYLYFFNQILEVTQHQTFFLLQPYLQDLKHVKINTTEVTAHLHNSFHSKPTKNWADTLSNACIRILL